jgi:hypothetical protein
MLISSQNKTFFQSIFLLLTLGGDSHVFFAASTDHRGTREYPGRTVTLERHEGEVTVSSVSSPCCCIQQSEAHHGLH